MSKHIPLTKGLVAIVDDADYEYLNQWKWYASVSGNRVYAIRRENVKGKNQGAISMHRVIMNTPEGFVCDHKDHNTLNNQRSNLRNCSYSQNAMNRTSRKGSTSKYIGVHRETQKYKDKVYTYWKAQLLSEGKKVGLGTYRTEDEAAIAYDEAAKKYFGEFANINFKELAEAI